MVVSLGASKWSYWSCVLAKLISEQELSGRKNSHRKGSGMPVMFRAVESAWGDGKLIKSKHKE